MTKEQQAAIGKYSDHVANWKNVRPATASKAASGEKKAAGRPKGVHTRYAVYQKMASKKSETHSKFMNGNTKYLWSKIEEGFKNKDPAMVELYKLVDKQFKAEHPEMCESGDC